MTDTNRPLRVFLCHSSHDKPTVRVLYQKLCAEKWIQPWLDEEELYPGQDWNLEIEKAIEDTEVIIVCLSRNSITKEGYVQREIRIALDYADYKPEGTLFIIPVRLEECEPPRRLRMWQYADYFEGQRERAFQRLLVSLKRRADSLNLKMELPSSDVVDHLIEIPSVETGGKISEKKLIVGLPLLEKKEEIIKDVETLEVPFSQNNKTTKKKKSPPESILPPKAEKATRGKKSIEKPSLQKKEKKEPVVEVSGTEKSSALPDKIYLSNGMEFMRVRAGKFLMGSTKSNKLAYEDEHPQHTVNINYDFWMARYLVTNEMYYQYIKNKSPHPVDGWINKKDHPVRLISWSEALAYCRWLNDWFKTELPSHLILRLPTEAEFEKAARGVDGYEYPWGNTFDKKKCNSGESNNNNTTAVGWYSPDGDSPCGCADIAGNVWEWTHSLKKEYPYIVNDGRENEADKGDRVIRGGSFISNSGLVRCACRAEQNSFTSYYHVGFRVCIAPPLPK